MKDNSLLVSTACWQFDRTSVLLYSTLRTLLYMTAKALIGAEALPGVLGANGDRLTDGDERAASLAADHLSPNRSGRATTTAISHLIAKPADIPHCPGDKEPEARNRLQDIDHKDKDKASNQAFEKQGLKISSRCLVARPGLFRSLFRRSVVEHGLRAGPGSAGRFELGANAADH